MVTLLTLIIRCRFPEAFRLPGVCRSKALTASGHGILN